MTFEINGAPSPKESHSNATKNATKQSIDQDHTIPQPTENNN